MSVTLNVNGTYFYYPEQGDVNWGTDATDWASAVTNGMLQKAGGAFTLTAEVDFGASYGLKSLYYKSRTANVATAGQLRLARADVISFRNQANAANLDLGVNASNELTFGGVALAVGGITSITGDVSTTGSPAATSTIGDLKVTNAMLAGSIDLTAKVTGALPILNGGTGVAAATIAAAFDGIAPTTAIGDLIIHNGTDNIRLAGNPLNTQLFLSSTGSGGVATAPSWQPVPVSGIFLYYLTPTVSGAYFAQTVAPYSPSTAQTSAAVTTGAATLIFTYISPAGSPNRTFIPAGEYQTHLHAYQSAGNRATQVYIEIWEANAAGADVALIGTAGPSSDLTGVSAEYYLGSAVPQYTLAGATSRIKTKVYAQRNSGGTDSTVVIDVGGATDTRQSLPAPVVDATNYVPYTGATTNLNMGANTVTAATFIGALTGNADTVTTNANLTGTVTSVGNATAIAAGAISNAMLANAAVANLTNTNSGDVTLGAVGAVPNANAASLAAQVLTLQPADGSNPGVITIGSQTIAGLKTLSTGLTVSGIASFTGTGATNSAILLPKDTTANRVTAAEGLVRYNTTLHMMEFANGATPEYVQAITKISSQKIVASTTYTPTTGTVYCMIEMVGAGGGGGGAAVTTFTAGAGGGGGSYAKIIVPVSQITGFGVITLNAAGTAGSNVGGDGGTGGTAVMTFASGDLTCQGGIGGTGSTATTTKKAGGLGGAISTYTGTASHIVTLQAGYAGGTGGAGSSAVMSFSGCGANSFFGAGGLANSGATGVGKPGLGNGSGGAGGTGATANLGGVGTIGCVVITEYRAY